MGEYAEYNGEQIKIGTCEDMYYLRADQRFKVTNSDVNMRGDEVHHIRFRFPWPDEDKIEPGSGKFHDNGYDRAVAVPGAEAPKDVEHHSVQFVAREPGYLISLPCPEGPDSSLPVHRNGFSGAVKLVRQKLLTDGRLVPVLRCGGCGGMWRVEEQHEIEAIAVAFRSEGDRLERAGEYNGTGKADRRFSDTIADRILAGAKILEEATP